MKETLGYATEVIGAKDGDEGKAVVVDRVTECGDMVIRPQGGSNAGHTLLLENGTELDLHQIPAGVLHDDTMNVCGSGMLLDAPRLVDEAIDLRERAGVRLHVGNFAISHEAHLAYPVHIELDEAREKKGKDAQGSTKAGIAFIASDKSLREGIRAESITTHTRDELYELALERRDILAKRYGLSRGRAALDKSKEKAVLFADAADQIRPFITDTVRLANSHLANGGHIILEGAQAHGLDLDHGKYPYVTSTMTTTHGLLSGAGIAPQHLKQVIGVVKAIPTKVGGGAFIGQIMDEERANRIRGERGLIDSEHGKTTGRPREIGTFDLPKLARSVRINGITELALTKVDWLPRLGDTGEIIVAYEVTDVYGNTTIELEAPSGNIQLLRCVPITEQFKTFDDPRSKRAKKYFKFIEEMLGVPITMIGVGPGRHDALYRHKKTHPRRK